MLATHVMFAHRWDKVFDSHDLHERKVKVRGTAQLLYSATPGFTAAVLERV